MNTYKTELVTLAVAMGTTVIALAIWAQWAYGHGWLVFVWALPSCLLIVLFQALLFYLRAKGEARIKRLRERLAPESAGD